MIDKFLPQDPRKMLLVDSLGALVTAAVTGCVLAPGVVVTGLPNSTLFVLALVVVAYFIVALWGSFRSMKPASVLRVMAAANLSYACVTAVLCAIYHDSLTAWALYFPAEIAVLVMLSRWEWKVAQRSSSA